jgi:hypothetical protein
MRPLVRSLATRPAAAGARLLRGPASAAVALALASLMPRLAAAQATEEGKACVALVDEFAESCADYAWYIEYPCLWLAGVGYMACVLVDLIVLLGKSISMPSPI